VQGFGQVVDGQGEIAQTADSKGNPQLKLSIKTNRIHRFSRRKSINMLIAM